MFASGQTLGWVMLLVIGLLVGMAHAQLLRLAYPRWRSTSTNHDPVVATNMASAIKISDRTASRRDGLPSSRSAAASFDLRLIEGVCNLRLLGAGSRWRRARLRRVQNDDVGLGADGTKWFRIVALVTRLLFLAGLLIPMRRLTKEFSIRHSLARAAFPRSAIGSSPRSRWPTSIRPKGTAIRRDDSPDDRRAREGRRSAERSVQLATALADGPACGSIPLVILRLPREPRHRHAVGKSRSSGLRFYVSAIVAERLAALGHPGRDGAARTR